MKTFRKYLLPGFVFQSVVIAGGYGTGRELAEFFLAYGPLGGLLAMVLVSTVIWSAVCAVSFELARMWGAYDYRSFFQGLLGRGWFLYEICYVIQLMLVLAVIAAAAGSIGEETFRVHYALGVLGVMAAVGFLTFKGSRVIENFLAGWSFVLYAVFLVFFVWSFVRFGDDIMAGFADTPVRAGWVRGGVEYAAYNLAIIPAILFCVRHVETRKEALTAGFLAGPIAILPGFLFLVAMAGHYPEIADETVPANFLLEALGSRSFQVLFQVILFGTLIETGTGMIHAVNERIARVYEAQGREMPAWWRPAVGTGLLVVGTLVASFGLVALIARGYGTLTWAFLAVYVIPVLTWGVWKLRGAPEAA